MSAFPETRYRCDRCRIEVSTAISNVPLPSRGAGPPDWLMLSLGHDPSRPPSHLCPECADRFTAFMSEVP